MTESKSLSFHNLQPSVHNISFLPVKPLVQWSGALRYKSTQIFLQNPVYTAGNRDITCQTVGLVTSKISWTKCISILWLIKAKAGGTWVERHWQLPYGKVFYRSIDTVPNGVFMAHPKRVIHFLFSSACSRTL